MLKYIKRDILQVDGFEQHINIEGPRDFAEAKERYIIVSSYLLRETKYGGKHFSSIEMLQLRVGGETSFLMTCQSACCVRDVKMSGVSSDISLGPWCGWSPALSTSLDQLSYLFPDYCGMSETKLTQLVLQ